ncbi:hypothetical protein V5799_033421 [Amblyomma americanum]|uniref:Uncharacterized protein n=1 Tax=Amblyomma americanum TaxID=6943 RepID=A0AAQ4DND1_AMBAM
MAANMASRKKKDAGAGGNSGRVFYTLQMDIALLLEVQASDPFRNPEQWDLIALRLRETLGINCSSRGVHERLDLLVSRYAANDRKNLQKSGTEEEYTERDQLLQDIIGLVQGTAYKIRGLNGRKENLNGPATCPAPNGAAAERRDANSERDGHAAHYAPTEPSGDSAGADL